MAVALASEILTTQPSAKDEKPPNRNNINNGSLLKLIIPGRRAAQITSDGALCGFCRRQPDIAPESEPSWKNAVPQVLLYHSYVFLYNF